MQAAHGLFERRQIEPFAQGGRHRIGDRFGVRLDGRADDTAHLIHRQAFGQPVTGDQTARLVRCLVRIAQPLHPRIADFPAALAALRFAGKQDRLSAAKLVDHPRLVEP